MVKKISAAKLTPTDVQYPLLAKRCIKSCLAFLRKNSSHADLGCLADLDSLLEEMELEVPFEVVPIPGQKRVCTTEKTKFVYRLPVWQAIFEVLTIEMWDMFSKEEQLAYFPSRSLGATLLRNKIRVLKKYLELEDWVKETKNKISAIGFNFSFDGDPKADVGIVLNKGTIGLNERLIFEEFFSRLAYKLKSL